MMAFKGMNPDEGRDVASAITDAGQQILDAIDSATGVVNSVEWVGPDYDAYQQDWNAFVQGPVNSLIEGFQKRADEMTKNADEQDDTSNQQ
jgi:hypothetical protein